LARHVGCLLCGLDGFGLGCLGALDHLVDALLRLGAAGAGQSSWGPAAYGVVGGEEAGRELVRHMSAELGGGARVELVRFDNRGARVERDEAAG
jgi:predicted sugar kinase